MNCKSNEPKIKENKILPLLLKKKMRKRMGKDMTSQINILNFHHASRCMLLQHKILRWSNGIEIEYFMLCSSI